MESSPHAALIAPALLHALLLGQEELALLDVREARAFVAGHLNLARLAPLSSLAIEIAGLVPRSDTPIVLVDAGDPDGPAMRAVAALARLGYTDLRVLEGGVAGWQAAGHAVIDGYATLVKAFGDGVRRHYATPTIGGRDVRARQATGAPCTLIDVRPADEYAYLTVAGTAHHPGTEIALRRWPTGGAASPWIVNCFSRTRGLVGTTTLRLLGHPDAHFLEDGVMQWALDGGPAVEAAPPAAPLPMADEATLHARARWLIDTHRLPVLDEPAFARLRARADRTVYVFDLRPETDAARLPAGVRAVAGGQLLMHFESLVGTRNACIVLLDAPPRLRAAITAFWLRQLNQAAVYILDVDVPSDGRIAGSVAERPMAPVAGGMSAAALADLLGTAAGTGHVRVVDVGPSADFVQGHLPGASFLLPFTLDPLAALDPDPDRIVFTSPDGRLAERVAGAARERWPQKDIRWLEGGTRAWQALGLPLDAAWTDRDLLTPFEDDWGSVMRVARDRRAEVWRDYLTWERGLGQRVARDPTVRFAFADQRHGLLPADPATGRSGSAS